MRPLSLVKYQPERSRAYLGSPSVVRLPDGALIVTHDYYGTGCPRNHESEESLTSVYRSEDDGLTWVNITHIMNCYWSTLFLHEGALWILGTSQQYGSIYIRRSDDGGFTWTHPIDDKTGILFRGGYYHDGPNYHCAPVAVTVHGGRIWKAFEDCTPCVWGTGFQACVISAPVGTDLLDASRWTMSNKLPFDPAWVPKAWGETRKPGWREGNVVADPSGQLWDIMTFEAGPLVTEKSARMKIEDEGRRIVFDPSKDYFDLPGCKAKLTIRRDERTGTYFTIGNVITDSELLLRLAGSPNTGFTHFHRDHTMRQRNRSMLCASDDLWNWRVLKVVCEDRSGLSLEDAIRLSGYQYTDWFFEGGDIVFAVRVAERGAGTFHDANKIMFGKIEAFRSLL
jgi:hypothetical protein